jgi:hypothetical protein
MERQGETTGASPMRDGKAEAARVREALHRIIDVADMIQGAHEAERDPSADAGDLRRRPLGRRRRAGPERTAAGADA